MKAPKLDENGEQKDRLFRRLTNVFETYIKRLDWFGKGKQKSFFFIVNFIILELNGFPVS